MSDAMHYWKLRQRPDDEIFCAAKLHNLSAVVFYQNQCLEKKPLNLMLWNSRKCAILSHKDYEMEDLLYNVSRFQSLSLFLSHLAVSFVERGVFVSLCTTILQLPKLSQKVGSLPRVQAPVQARHPLHA